MLLIGGTRVSDRVVLQNGSGCFAPNPDSRDVLTCTIILNEIAFDSVTVPSYPREFISEIDALLGVATNLVVSQNVVAVLVPNRYPVATVVFQHVLFEDSVPHTPAKKQAVRSIIAGDTFANGGALRAAPWMQPQA